MIIPGEQWNPDPASFAFEKFLALLQKDRSCVFHKGQARVIDHSMDPHPTSMRISAMVHSDWNEMDQQLTAMTVCTAKPRK
jgi:hypothetical protein